jgi:hypothetical protein
VVTAVPLDATELVEHLCPTEIITHAGELLDRCGNHGHG